MLTENDFFYIYNSRDRQVSRARVTSPAAKNSLGVLNLTAHTLCSTDLGYPSRLSVSFSALNQTRHSVIQKLMLYSYLSERMSGKCHDVSEYAFFPGGVGEFISVSFFLLLLFTTRKCTIYAHSFVKHVYCPDPVLCSCPD